MATVRTEWRPDMDTSVPTPECPVHEEAPDATARRSSC